MRLREIYTPPNICEHSMVFCNARKQGRSVRESLA